MRNGGRLDDMSSVQLIPQAFQIIPITLFEGDPDVHELL
jgi:hypothetical protein